MKFPLSAPDQIAISRAVQIGKLLFCISTLKDKQLSGISRNHLPATVTASRRSYVDRLFYSLVSVTCHLQAEVAQEVWDSLAWTSNRESVA